MWADTSRKGRPFAKDPSVIRFNGRYLLYYSMPPYGAGRPHDGWAIGIAASDDLVRWHKASELLPAHDYDRKGIAAPGAIVLDGKVHLFYQTYGNGPRDAICHAVSADGINFTANLTNPVFQPTGSWNVGRAIDAEAFEHNRRLLLYFATRDPAMKVQMLGVASAARDSGFGRFAWEHLSENGPILKPELPWETACIEAPTICRHGDTLFMFYAGGYNNEPQQIGCATSHDGMSWTRLSDQPFLPNGQPGEWNSSESGHPSVFVDTDGQTYLFYQGNNDNGQSWHLSHVKIGWQDKKPYIIR